MSATEQRAAALAAIGRPVSYTVSCGCIGGYNDCRESCGSGGEYPCDGSKANFIAALRREGWRFISGAWVYPAHAADAACDARMDRVRVYRLGEGDVDKAVRS